MELLKRIGGFISEMLWLVPAVIYGAICWVILLFKGRL